MSDKDPAGTNREDALAGAKAPEVPQGSDEQPEPGDNQDVLPQKIYPSDPTGGDALGSS